MFFINQKKNSITSLAKMRYLIQGLIAEVEQVDDITLKDFLKNNLNENLNLIALEDVTDPRNIGAIIRSAVAFNIDGLIVKERSFPLKVKSCIKVLAEE